MIRRLEIKNIALVDQLTLDFERGMTVLTGETGAGKSVIVTALSLAFGGRAEKEYIRHGCDKAVVRVEIDLDGEEKGEKRTCLIEREISRNGGSRIRINGQTATLASLRAVSGDFAQILSQHAGTSLLDENSHLELLDRTGGLESLREEVAAKFAQWQENRQKLKGLTRKKETLLTERELAEFQKKEIEDAAITPGEEAQILVERKIMDSSRLLMESSARAQQLVAGDEQSLVDLLGQLHRELDKMSAIDPSLVVLGKSVETVWNDVEEVRREIERYGSLIPDDPQRLEQINIRLDEIHALKRKYGGSEESILAHLDKATERLQQGEDVDREISLLQQRVVECETAYTESALKLSARRKKAATRLEKEIKADLKDLAIPEATFSFELLYEESDDGIFLGQRRVKPTQEGLERGRILFSANPGEPAKSLAKTASGGEISRVLLALKSAELKSRKSASQLLVFDEVDAGIGGQTATNVAEKLKLLSNSCQLLVITHLHQIARLADHHFAATKSPDGGNRTVIKVEKLNKSKAAAEIKRMVALPSEQS